MRKVRVKNFAFAVLCGLALIAIAIIYFTANPKQKIVREAYIYGYPLVTMDMTRRQETNVRLPDDAHAPTGQFIKLRTYPAVDNHTAAAPNADTLYTMVWLDVSTEPWVFSIPDMGDRYYIMPMLSGFNEVFFVADPRTTGGNAQKYAVTGPGWSGTLPEGVTQVKSPTALVWILGRIYCTGTSEDYKAVQELQDQYSVVPLSAYGRCRRRWRGAGGVGTWLWRRPGGRYPTELCVPRPRGSWTSRG